MGNELELRRKVHNAYSAAALQPGSHHAFPVGRQFAESLGYQRGMLADLPPACSEAFSGVSTVSLFAEFPTDGTILDLGCGAGLDSIIAARRAGPNVKVIGLDFSLAMLARAAQTSRSAGLHSVLLCQADAERLPLRDHSIAVAMVNGIFNLNPARRAIFSELGRVVKPGGALFAAARIRRSWCCARLFRPISSLVKPTGLRESLALRRRTPSLRSSGRPDSAIHACCASRGMPAPSVPWFWRPRSVPESPSSWRRFGCN
jgi:SAM-dependent methyltransferase